ncbi:MAG: hypothetical protein KatS3mg111_3017 [Pirellulaceae bacterium]|nr:MAG: hypothetical protein KatS3mg111_3017 [Pirellulaceae bacterium]
MVPSPRRSLAASLPKLSIGEVREGVRLDGALAVRVLETLPAAG